MNKTRRISTPNIGFLTGTALLGALTGCVGYVDRPPQARVYEEPPSAYVERQVVVQPDYVYYPAYEVYYSDNTHRYVYRDGRSWVSRSAPPRVSPDVLHASPSVRMDFHDAPAAHHATIVRTYPKNWMPPGSSHGHPEENTKGHKKD